MRKRAVIKAVWAGVAGGLMGGVVAVSGLSCANKATPVGRDVPVADMRVPSARDGDEAARLREKNLPAWMWTYDRIEPKVILPATRPSTQPAPLDAIDQFVIAREAMLEGRRFTALQSIQKSAELDPDSAEVQRLLAQVLVEAEGGPNALASAAIALEKAGALDGDDLETWVRLGRIQLARDQKEAGLRALRMATLTTEYNDEPARAAVVDLYLARALQVNGYDRAALDRYDRVLKSVAGLGKDVRENAELALISQRPEVLYTEIATLYERHDQFADAARVLDLAVKNDPDSFDTAARYVRVLMSAKKTDQALEVAGGLVVRFRADEPSMALLASTYRAAGREAEMVGELRKLHQIRPLDRPVLLALVEALRQSGKGAEAETLLEDAVAQSGATRGGSGGGYLGAELTRRLVSMRIARGEIRGAAKAIIGALAAAPSDAPELSEVFDQLTRTTLANRLQVAQIVGLDVPQQQRGARDYLAARAARKLQRGDYSDQLLESASATFSPALLESAERVLVEQEPGWEKQFASLEELAGKLGGKALVQAVQGRRMLKEEKYGQAAQTLADAVAAGVDDSRTQVYLANALESVTGGGPLAEQVLVKVASENPTDPIAQDALVSRYRGTGRISEAERVVNQWVANSSTSVDARVWQVRLAGRDPVAASADAAKLVEAFPDSNWAVQATVAAYMAAGKNPTLETKLAEVAEKQPRGIAALTAYVSMASEAGKRPDAERAVARSRAACAGDADLLYYIAAICQVYDLDSEALETLTAALQADPKHLGAANDLAYMRADSLGVGGDQLAECERLAQLAVAGSPRNASYLDTLGWVHYKRRKFAEAGTELAKAAEIGARKNAEVLDHLGDTLYRTGDRDKALETWREALSLFEKGEASRREKAVLRLKLQTKIERAARGDDVEVAPVP